ncbi:MAG: glycosyltransferase family 87 protein [Armatimonadota bacterium]|nr:glycosyltransferase family 87 protein [Armatimonadota bacterium]
MKLRWYHILAFTLLAAYCIRLLYGFAQETSNLQWDFRTYYYAAKAHKAGLNPYSLTDLSHIAGKSITLRYVYPPIILYFFRIFALLPYTAAYWAWLLLKSILLFALIRLWIKVFLIKEADLFFYVFCAFAFTGSLFHDIIAGNISIVEQFLLWQAFAFYLKRKTGLFCIFLTLASIFKLTPILFLLLLLFRDDRKRFLYAVVSLSIFTTAILLPILHYPNLGRSFLNIITRLDERAEQYNPSTLSFIRDVCDLAEKHIGIKISSLTETTLFLAICIAVLAVSWWALRKNSLLIKADERIGLFLWCFALALVMPRFKSYSYILLLAPAYYLIKNTKHIHVSTLLFLIAASPTPEIVLGFGLFGMMVASYFLLLLIFGLWGLFIYEMTVSSREIKLEASRQGRIAQITQRKEVKT